MQMRKGMPVAIYSVKQISNLLQIGLGCTLTGICVALVTAACIAWKLRKSCQCQCQFMTGHPSSSPSMRHRHSHDVQVVPVSAPGTLATSEPRLEHEAQP